MIDIMELVEIALDAVNPRNIVKKVEFDDHVARVGKHEVAFRDLYLVAFGKAAIPMAEEILKVHAVKDGVVIAPEERELPVRVIKGGHPIPNEGSIEGGKAALEIMRNAGEEDLVICLISGGGSALMEYPLPPITLKDMQDVTRELLKAGADIYELNAVRKHLSGVKGGRLAAATQANVISLILSDVLENDLSVIASGPTYPDSTTYEDAIKVMDKYGIKHQKVREFLESGARGEYPETPKSLPSRIFNYLAGTNEDAIIAMENYARTKGYNTIILTTRLQGEAREVGLVLASIAREIYFECRPIPPPAVVLFAGETTVTVKGKGIGGRNQELVLSAARRISGLKGVTIFSFGTDGIDGVSPAAGGYVNWNTLMKARQEGLDIDEYLSNNDSYTFLSKIGQAIITGRTSTNVADVGAIIVNSRKNCK